MSRIHLETAEPLMKSVFKALSVCALIILLASHVRAQEPAELSAWKEVLVQKLLARGVGEGEARAFLDDPRVAVYPEILEKKGKGIDYFSRRFGLLTRPSIERGRQVIRDNLTELNRIEASFGVEKEVLVAVYRVETYFGGYTGGYPVFNSLLTLTVLENRRSAWAENEWINLILLSKERGFDPLAIKGSWAGAFGLCQFVPSAYLKYGVDGNGDGRVDLFNVVDALASIANYLKGSGWEQGSLAKKKKAIYAYNHCDNYVKAVLAYAKAIRKAPRSTTAATPRRSPAQIPS
ncbi:MAG TPA: lytic murein transglycosylase [Syntrophorhabdales bacterium]|nr:lytic murein transglycosylase [Syntrophorhabdales bacterium]